MSSLNKFQLFLIVGISILVGYIAGTVQVKLAWQHYAPQFSVINREPPAGIVTVDMAPFWAVWQKVYEGYYDKSALDQKKMLNGAITGMVQAIGDPFTMYLPPTQNKGFQSDLAGQFEGIGAELGMNADKQIIIISPLSGSPAIKAGLLAGDIVAKVNGTYTDGWTIAQAVEKIRGPKGTQVTLSVLHKGDNKLTDISINRDTITVKSVDGWVKQVKDIPQISSTVSAQLKNDSVGYIRLSQFGDSTNKDWSALITELLPQLQKSDGIILDLRNNPGGYLLDAQYIASEFLPVGKTVVMEEAADKTRTSLTVERKGNLLSIPMVVLINGGSASASEIVSGALQDYGRAKLVGEQSFGKGTVQQALDLGDGAGLHVTIAKWLTPTGRWIHTKGLTPDVIIHVDPTDQVHDGQLEAAVKLLVQ